MTTLSTHDTKRSEDVRARLAVRRELPGRVGRRSPAGAPPAPYRAAELDANTEYLLWQTAGRRVAARRATAARRTSRRRSARPSGAHDVDGAGRGIRGGGARLRRAGARRRRRRRRRRGLGRRAGRRAGARQRARAEAARAHRARRPRRLPGHASSWTCRWSTPTTADRSTSPPARPAGPPRRRRRPGDLDDEKLLVTSRALRLRREHPEWFGAGSTYQVLSRDSEHLVAFSRAERVVVAVQRLAASGTDGSARLDLPPGRWRDLLGGASLDGEVPLTTLFGALPVALLVAADDPVPS